MDDDNALALQNIWLGKEEKPSRTFLPDDGALHARNWREIVSSTAFNNDKHFPSSPLKGKPYAIVKRSSSCRKK